MTTITADYDVLFMQASDMVGFYLARATQLLDQHFGENFTRENPAYAMQLVDSMVKEFSASTFAKSVGEIADVIGALKKPGE